MYLMLSVAGHLTIFLTRTHGPFWSIRPAPVLWAAVVGTQVLATLIAVYGFLMTPLGWGWAAFVWGYAIVWFLVSDRIKLLAYRFLDTRGGRRLQGRHGRGALRLDHWPRQVRRSHAPEPSRGGSGRSIPTGG